jgi:hypothetical protein
MQLSVKRSWLLLLLTACLPSFAAPADPWAGVRHRAGSLEAPSADVQSLEDKDVQYFQSPLSPGVLLRMKSRRIRFFSDLEKYGAEAPTVVWVRTSTGIRTLKRGESIGGEALAASWLVTSFQDAVGWEQFDVPWFLSLERRPLSITLTRDGLQLEFATAQTGYIFSMPLFGYDKPPQRNNLFTQRHKLPSINVEPWSWEKEFPASVERRCDWWASVAKAYPLGFQESFRVDPSEDRITFRQDYRWLTISDDWNTRVQRFAVIPPSVALARKFPGYPLEFPDALHDPEYFTAFGPLVGALDTDRIEYSMKVLQYLNEREDVRLTRPLSALQRTALDRVSASMKAKFPAPWKYEFDHGDRSNFCWNIAGDVWYPRALPLVDAELRRRAASSLRVYLENEVLKPHSPYHGKYILHGPGIGSWGEWGDAGKFMTIALQPIWAYAEFSNDWDLIRSRWELVKRFFVTPEETNWLSYGRHSIAEIGDEAAPCSAYARMAWRVGDQDEYLFGAYMFARELTHLYIKQTAGQFFYEHQPYHDSHPMPSRIYPTDVWGSTSGWQVDGPTWGHLSSGEHQSANRWVRFQDPDVGRFYHDLLAASVRQELDWYEAAGRGVHGKIYRGEAYEQWLGKDNPHTLPSLLRLRSLLLNQQYEPREALSHLDRLHSGWGASDIAVAYSVLRTSTPREQRRIIPKTLGPSPWVLGLQRQGNEDAGSPVQEIREQGLGIEPLWYGWGMPRNPIPGGDRGYRSFGMIAGDFDGQVRGAVGSKWISYGVRAGWANGIKPRTLTGNPGRPGAPSARAPVLVIGPFSNANDNELTDRIYPPETESNRQASYPGASGPVSWKRTALSEGGGIDLTSELAGPDGVGTLAYVLQYVWAPAPTDIYLLAGHQGGVVAWINNEIVIRHHGVHRSSGDDSARGLGHLRQGWNRLLLKVESFTGRSVVQFRFVHLDGGPLPGLRFSDEIQGGAGESAVPKASTTAADRPLGPRNP